MKFNRILLNIFLCSFLSAILFDECIANPNKGIISAYTSGTISKTSVIQFQFINDLGKGKQLNQPIDKSPFEFNPEIKGVAVWTNTKTLEFRPSEKWEQGQKYLATLNFENITADKEKLKPFKFNFTIIKQTFDVNIDGLQADGQRDTKKVKLTGKLTTADIEESENIKKVLTAEQRGKLLNIQWTHSEDSRVHTFVITNIFRENEYSEVLVKWNGKPIGVDKADSTNIEVPMIKPFEVLKVKSINEEEQYIEIRFTDSLDPNQDLTGLIAIKPGRNLKFNIDGSIIKAYSSSRWDGNVNINIAEGVKSSLGLKLGAAKKVSINVGDTLPKVRFVGKGAIIPTTYGLTIPIEAINLKSVIVEAVQIYDTTMPQFLQVSTLNEGSQLHRVGRMVWKKRVQLGFLQEKKNQWLRYGLDVNPLIQNHTGGMYRLTLTFKQQDVAYECDKLPKSKPAIEREIEVENWDEGSEDSNWDYYEEQNSECSNDYDNCYTQRFNPCHAGFYSNYSDHNIKVSRNVLISDIGLIAKRGNNDELVVIATDLKTTQPLIDVTLTLMNYQQQILGTAKTNSEGMASIRFNQKPFLIVAENGVQRGYLKLDDGQSLSLSQFDVAGQTIEKGVKGFIYGERGVWRPGDNIYLTFILFDKDNRFPKNHPVIFELLNPKGQLIKLIKKTEGLNGFYNFQTSTDIDAPTGDWTAKIKVGGAVFEKPVKIATVMPNRLKIKLDFGKDVKSLSGGSVNGNLSATWLHGAIAKNLRADVKLSFNTTKTEFPKYEEYIFDDPVRKYEPEEQDVFDGVLDQTGKISFNSKIQTQNVSPGMLNANFKTRVFEEGGAFSVDQFSLPYHPYERYVGILTPKGDVKRSMVLTDIKHTVNIVMIDKNGKLVPSGKVEIGLYKIKWRWWWDKGEEEPLASYVGSSSYTSVKTDFVEIKNGVGEWNFEVKYPEWGRFLIRAKDASGNHYTGKVLYIDWPGWAGRNQKDTPGGSTMLTFSSDKEAYIVGEKITLTIPTGKKGRGLISLETGSKVLQAKWIEATGEDSKQYSFFATQEMSPNIYAHVTFIQPHMQTENDLPIRMYGVIPIKIEDPATRLEPKLESKDVFKPEETIELFVTEAGKKPMTYTVAVVDEGLLDLTRFKTPDPWNYFYLREALGVKTWDLYELVTGAYGGTFEKLLAIGGDTNLRTKGGRKANRFPPMVRFIGPFELESGGKAVHKIAIPQYIGSVRTMIVAGQNGAFGFAEKAVPVRKPIMVLGTLPRVLGPDEEVALPVTVFVMEDKIKSVKLNVKPKPEISVLDTAEKTLNFKQMGDETIDFNLKVSEQIGISGVSIQAACENETAKQDIEIDVRSPSGKVVDVISTNLNVKENWDQDISLIGTPGTNTVMLEVSKIPPINLEQRLGYLIQYPHGCVEQTTSAVFPQLYLNKLLDLSKGEQDQIQNNIQKGIEKIQTFQTPEGGFTYWQGFSKADDWASSYVGHFLIEAEKIGYLIPPKMLDLWKQYQRRIAQSWEKSGENSDLVQSYRLYTLALSGSPELGAMNRLREESQLSTSAKWRLAAAYFLAGQKEACEQLISNTNYDIPKYRELSNTYGSDLRDKAMILETLSLMNRLKDALPLVTEISQALSSEKYLSTQTTAYALIAITRHVMASGGTGKASDMKFAFTWNKDKEQVVSSVFPIFKTPLAVDAKITKGAIKLKNTGDMMIYPRLILSGIPKQGNETASQNGIKLEITYKTAEGEEVDCRQIDQGTDFISEVKVTNTGFAGEYKEIALSHLIPSGWEIHNERLNSSELPKNVNYNYQDIRDDRIYTYFNLKQGETKTFKVLLNASYLGKFYLPMVSVEAMYDATLNARVPGQWISVVEVGTVEHKEKPKKQDKPKENKEEVEGQEDSKEYE
ncbi:MAG: hypothetical protein HQK79_14850 [Desulfobacterales bacterium]|nr:hypothetical protein [Desulfobacterales bacterium]MBF0397832.1 hypothetical protein [Desulfobacterales bacterium]